MTNLATKLLALGFLTIASQAFAQAAKNNVEIAGAWKIKSLTIDGKPHKDETAIPPGPGRVIKFRKDGSTNIWVLDEESGKYVHNKSSKEVVVRVPGIFSEWRLVHDAKFTEENGKDVLTLKLPALMQWKNVVVVMVREEKF